VPLAALPVFDGVPVPEFEADPVFVAVPVSLAVEVVDEAELSMN
jgi:hypothetical protein